MEVWKRKSHYTTVTDNVQQTLSCSLAYLVIQYGTRHSLCALSMAGSVFMA